MNEIQVDLLRRYRAAGERERERVRRPLLRSIAGIAAALRNRGGPGTDRDRFRRCPTFSLDIPSIAPYKAPETFLEGAGISNIREVAKESGVSVSTVSRVFNGYDDVSPATRERVMDVARRLDYAPSAAARTLVKQRSQLIGVVLFTGYEHPDIHHPFFQEVLVGLKHGIGELGYDLLLFATEQPGSSRGRPHSYLRRAHQHRVDGLVVMGVDREDPEVEKLVRADIPVMAVDLDVVHDHTSFVGSDNIGGARLAVRHLHSLGHTRIATISGPRNTKPGADRTLGFRAEMRELGLKIPRGYEIEGDFYPESGERAMQSLLRLAEPPTAVFAAADMMAVGAIRTSHAAGLSVPDDLAIVGFDDIRVAELLSPPLTTVRQDMVGIGLAAGRGLVEQIENPDVTPPVLTLPVELVVRASCGARASAAADS